MSFRTRLISFFLVIVVVPMLAIGLLVFRLISDSAQGKADARANGIATAAATMYTSESAAAGAGARTIARNAAVAGPVLRGRLAALAGQTGIARVRVRMGRRVLADFGDRTAVAPGVAVVHNRGLPGRLSVITAVLTGGELARELAGLGVAIVVTQGCRTVGSWLRNKPRLPLAGRGTISIGGTRYRAITQTFPSFNGPLRLTVLSAFSATASARGTDRLVAVAFIAGFLLLALSFAILASRALQGQLGRFLQAARRLAGGDFSAAVPTEGRDEFAELGTEFNNMSAELERRLHELTQERTRLRESIQRIGQTFAANLDRQVLLDVALKTAVDAVGADCGRLSVRFTSDEPLSETGRVGSLNGVSERIFEAERAALSTGTLGEVAADEANVLAAVLRPVEPGSRVHGLITVARRDHPFGEDDRSLLQSLASQATLALENVELHFQVQRQAVTDELTGLANHGHFQELLGTEIERVRRSQRPVGLIMLDIDDFKAVNDTYGHQQGDVVLKHVARVLSETSREIDTAARYGGEEMAVILPDPDLAGPDKNAEAARGARARPRITRRGHQGFPAVTGR